MHGERHTEARLPVDVQLQVCLVQFTLLLQIAYGWGAAPVLACCLTVPCIVMGLNWLYRLAHHCLAGHSFV